MKSEEYLDALYASMEKEKDVSKNFFEWLRENKKYFLLLLSILPVVITYWGKFIKNSQNKGLVEWTQQNTTTFICITAAIQCLFILFVIFLPVKEKRFRVDFAKRKNSSDANDEIEIKVKANKALMQFKSAWTFVWTYWFLLYLTLFIQYLSLSKIYESSYLWFADIVTLFKNLSHLTNISQLFLNLFNNCSTAAFVICYLIFSRITVPDKKSLKPAYNLYWAIGLSAIILALVGAIDVIRPGNPVTSWGSSLCAGIAMAFFIGRQNNKFINPSIFIIVCLYFYIAIQTLFPFWVGSNKNLIVLLSANLAFIFKIVLYLFMLWLFRSGRLLFYFKKERALEESINDQWERFQSSDVF
jgi:hypothetical protein